MTVLGRALIKSFPQPTSRSRTAGERPQVAVPHVAVSRAVPLSRAPADLAVTPAAPSVKPPSLDQSPVGVRKEVGGGDLRPMAAQLSTAPVGPSVAALLHEAFQATAPVGPSVATLLHEVYQAKTVVARITAPVGPSVAALLHEATQAKMVALESPSPAEIGNSTPVTAEASTVNGAAVTTPPAHTVTITRAQGETPWVPLQADRVVWPSILGQLQTTAAAAIEQMTDGLLSICASGSKILGMASCASGEGVTTLLLAVARKLVSQGRKVVLVDSNWSNPQLAQSLGLSPQFGWEETLCGRMPLEKVAIESRADGLVVLPIREPSARAIAQEQIAPSLDILSREFDVVLVDLGSLAHQVEDEGPSSYGVAARMDALFLVQNVHVTTPNRLAEVRRRLVASNLPLSGTIQNFVVGSHDHGSRQSQSRFLSACHLLWHFGLVFFQGRNRNSTWLIVGLGWVR